MYVLPEDVSFGPQYVVNVVNVVDILVIKTP
jgi:hypothetical protein